MRLSRQKASPLLICVATILLCASCESKPSEPLDSTLSGDWIIPGVDTWQQLSLQQRGTAITGTFGFYSPVAKPLTFELVGSAALPHVLLTWTLGTVPLTFDATLSDDGESMTGSINGGPNVTYRRNRSVTGATPPHE